MEFDRCCSGVQVAWFRLLDTFLFLSSEGIHCQTLLPRSEKTNSPHLGKPQGGSGNLASMNRHENEQLKFFMTSFACQTICTEVQRVQRNCNSQDSLYTLSLRNVET